MILRLLSFILSIFFTFGTPAVAYVAPADFSTVVEPKIDHLVEVVFYAFPELELPPDS